MNEKEIEAFVGAYSSNVAHAKDETVRAFVKEYEAGVDGNDLYEKYGQDYATILDALLMWQDAKAFYYNIN
jgi:hypothetical protein